MKLLAEGGGTCAGGPPATWRVVCEHIWTGAVGKAVVPLTVFASMLFSGVVYRVLVPELVFPGSAQRTRLATVSAPVSSCRPLPRGRYATWAPPRASPLLALPHLVFSIASSTDTPQSGCAPPTTRERGHAPSAAQRRPAGACWVAKLATAAAQSNFRVTDAPQLVARTVFHGTWHERTKKTRHSPSNGHRHVGTHCLQWQSTAHAASSPVSGCSSPALDASLWGCVTRWWPCPVSVRATTAGGGSMALRPRLACSSSAWTRPGRVSARHYDSSLARWRAWPSPARHWEQPVGARDQRMGGREGACLPVGIRSVLSPCVGERVARRERLCAACFALDQ